MHNHNNNSSTREHINAAKSSAYTPRITIQKSNRNAPSDIKNKIDNTGHPVKVPISYSTISVASASIILTAIFCCYCVIHKPVSSITKGLFILLSAAFWCFFMAVFVPPIPQSQSYHNFADRRSLRQLIPLLSFIKFPNALDVLSNIPFLIVGLYGLYLLVSETTIIFLTHFEEHGWIIFFTSITFVCFGSAYYHLSPSNSTLVWDRLPMTVGFSSLLALLIYERINPVFGQCLFPVLFIAGFVSCAYWYYSDDLRPYILLQFCPMFYIPILLLISSPVYTDTLYYIYACVLYSLAKVSEVADKKIFRLSSKSMSGHTVKHILSSSAIGVILYMLNVRVIL